MAHLKVSTRGFAEFRREMEAKVANFPEAVTKALQAGADVMLDAMQQCADEAFTSRTGDLRKGIKIKSLSTQTGSVKVGVWGDDVPYAYYVENGHAPPYTSARPRDWDTNRGITSSTGRKGKDAVKRRREEMAARKRKGNPTPPHPFIEPGYLTARCDARDAIQETFKKEAGL